MNVFMWFSLEVALVVDVEKAFLQVGLQSDDRNVTSTESHQSSIQYDIHSISFGRNNKKLSNEGWNPHRSPDSG